jgi:hypothetical protein
MGGWGDGEMGNLLVLIMGLVILSVGEDRQ